MYDSACFDKLPSIGKATTALTAIDGDGSVSTYFRGSSFSNMDWTGHLDSYFSIIISTLIQMKDWSDKAIHLFLG
jgi:hypothetical protein